MGGRCLKHKSAACRPPAGLAAEETSPVPAPLGRAAALLPPGAAVPVQGFGALPSPCPGVRPSAVSHSCPFNGVRRSALRSSGLSHRPMGGKAALGGISQWPRSAPPPPSRAAKGASGARRGRPSVRAVREGPQRRRHGRVSAGVGLPSVGPGGGCARLPPGMAVKPGCAARLRERPHRAVPGRPSAVRLRRLRRRSRPPPPRRQERGSPRVERDSSGRGEEGGKGAAAAGSRALGQPDDGPRPLPGFAPRAEPGPGAEAEWRLVGRRPPVPEGGTSE